jgi:hypothetical protein
MADLSNESITALFDQLVSENIIVYGPHESIKCEAEGYPVRHSISINIACTWLIRHPYSSSLGSART